MFMYVLYKYILCCTYLFSLSYSSQLHLTHIAAIVTSCGYTTSYSLPLLTHLSHTSLPLFIKLDPLTYLVMATLWQREVGAIEENFHLMRVTPSSFLPTPNDSNDTIPKAFLKVEALIRINTQDIFDQFTGAIISKTTPIFVLLIFIFGKMFMKIQYDIMLFC